MSVTGFDNVAVSTFVWPNLTTLDLPRVQMGRMSVDTLLEVLADGESTVRRPIELPVELVVRQSSGVVGASQGESMPAATVMAVEEKTSER
jgi:DNA-binding LacI/PurR family transcriptional regulator